MAVTVRVSGIPVTVNGTDDRLEAQQKLQEAAVRDPEEWTRMIRQGAQSRQEQAGLSEDDIEAIVRMSDPRVSGKPGMFQGLHTPEEPGALEKFLIGAGETFTSHARGATQLVSQAADRVDPSGQLRERLGVKGMEELAQEEAEARRIFNELDAGVGMEDAGELLTESLMFLGGGSLGIGKRMVLGTVQGALAGATAGRTDAESLASNTAWAAGMGAAGNAMVGGLKGVAKLTGRTGVAMGNMISALSAIGRGNGFLFGSATARMFMTNNWAAKQMARGLPRGGTRNMTHRQMQQMQIARKLRDQASEILSGMKPRYQQHAARQAAKEAFDRSLAPSARRKARETLQNQQTAREVVGRSERAVREGFPVSREGGQQFLPSKFVQSLSGISDAKLKNMGAFGHRMKDFRKFARAIEDMEGLEPDDVLTAINAISDNPEARRLITSLAKSRKQEVKRRIFERIVTSGVTGPVRAATQLPGASVPASAEMFGRDFGNAIFVQPVAEGQ